MPGTDSRRPRVLAGAFQLEANTFVPARTGLADMRRQTWLAGGDLRRGALDDESELAGAWDALADAGAALVPALAACASPGAPLTAEAFAAVLEGMLAPAGGVDGALVVLHGAAVADGEDDPEGALLAALRTRLGPDAPIAVTLDHHAHLTRRMVDAADVLTAYRTCPHVDLRERGTQAGRLLADALAGRTRPVLAVAERPMITAADRHDTSRPPFSDLMAGCDRAEAAGALSAALLTVQPWLDLPGLGWKAAVTADGDRALAERLAEELIEAAWRARRAMAGEGLPAIEEALAIALAGPAPYVVADAGDATNGGSLGDSTVLLRAALGHPGTPRVLLSVRDPGAARAAVAAGAGARVRLTLGGGAPGAHDARTELDSQVRRVGGGPIRYTHPAATGTDDLGAAALVRTRAVDVVVHEHPVRVIDPAIYAALGANPSSYDVVQAKSQVSYRAGFAPVSTRSVVCDTPGPTSASLARLPYTRRPRPLFPFEDVAS